MVKDIKLTKMIIPRQDTMKVELGTFHIQATKKNYTGWGYHQQGIKIPQGTKTHLCHFEGHGLGEREWCYILLNYPCRTFSRPWFLVHLLTMCKKLCKMTSVHSSNWINWRLNSWVVGLSFRHQFSDSALVLSFHGKNSSHCSQIQ